MPVEKETRDTLLMNLWFPVVLFIVAGGIAYFSWKEETGNSFLTLFKGEQNRSKENLDSDEGTGDPSGTGGKDASRSANVLYQRDVFGYTAMCARMNTFDWGYGVHYDKSEPEVRSFVQMQQAFDDVGLGGGEKVVLIQGTEVTVVPVSDPKLSKMANKSQVCVPLTSQP